MSFPIAHITRPMPARSRLILLLSALVLSTATLPAADWYVKAKASADGNGSKNQPFNALQQAESASQPGDTIYIVQSPSGDVLDGGIQLKTGQKLIGLGPKVTNANPNSARAQLTNTMRSRYDGDIVRLAKNNKVENIHFDNAYRASIFGINADGAELRDNLVTNDMAVHNLFAIEGPAPSTCGVVAGNPVCTGEWPNGFILFAPQTNHFGAITLVACGPDARVLFPRPDLLVRPVSYCEFLVPGSGAITSPVDYEISGNVIRDSNSDGMMLINDTGVTANMHLEDNTVKNLSQRLPDPSQVGSTNHVVRSRGVTAITIDRSVSNLEMNHFVGSNLSPFGTFAADGIVFLDCGVNPITNARLEHLLIENPLLSGDTTNGDSIEIQHRGSTNGILNVRIKDAVLKDPASTNIKLIDSTNPDNGIYNVTVQDSVLSNINGAGNEDAQIRYNGTQTPTGTKAIYLKLKNVQISGLGRGIGVAGVPPANASNLLTLQISIEDSSLSDLTREALLWINPASRSIGTVGGAVIDLGGGPLGSRGGNRFVRNGVPGYVPPGADPSGIDTTEGVPPVPVVFDGDISVANARPATDPAIHIYAENNYWGGNAPVLSPARGLDVFIPTGSNVVYHVPATFLTADPRRR